MARVGPQRHKKKNDFHIKVGLLPAHNSRIAFVTVKCVHRAVRAESLYIIQVKLSLETGRTMAQAVRRCPLTAEALLLSQVSAR